jgi:hypothetical protein
MQRQKDWLVAKPEHENARDRKKASRYSSDYTEGNIVKYRRKPNMIHGRFTALPSGRASQRWVITATASSLPMTVHDERQPGEMVGRSRGG